MDSKEIARRSAHCEYIVKKRHNNFDYIERAFCDAVFWMNSVRMSGDAIISMQDPDYLRIKTEQFYILSLNLAKLVDMGNMPNFIKALQQLFEEYNNYFSGDAKLNPVILNTQTFVLQSCRKAQHNAKQQREKQRLIVHSLAANYASVKEDERVADSVPVGFFPEELEISTDYEKFKEEHTKVGLPAEFSKAAPIKQRKVVSKNPVLYVLSIVNVPFDLCFKEVISGLCETMKVAYNKFFDIQSIDDGALKQILKADQTMKKAVIQPLCDMINDAAEWTIKHQVDNLFKDGI